MRSKSCPALNQKSNPGFDQRHGPGSAAPVLLEHDLGERTMHPAPAAPLRKYHLITADRTQTAAECAIAEFNGAVAHTELHPPLFTTASAMRRIRAQIKQLDSDPGTREPSVSQLCKSCATAPHPTADDRARAARQCTSTSGMFFISSFMPVAPERRSTAEGLAFSDLVGKSDRPVPGELSIASGTAFARLLTSLLGNRTRPCPMTTVIHHGLQHLGLTTRSRGKPRETGTTNDVSQRAFVFCA